MNSNVGSGRSGHSHVGSEKGNIGASCSFQAPLFQDSLQRDSTASATAGVIQRGLVVEGDTHEEVTGCAVLKSNVPLLRLRDESLNGLDDDVAFPLVRGSPKVKK